MNIFVLDENPITAAKYLDDVRIPKMCVESAQMMASALRRHGATDEQMPLRKDGKSRYKGGYKNHPCTLWAGDSWANFDWLVSHAIALCVEYSIRFGKEHACLQPIAKMGALQMQERIVPKGKRTPFAQAMPDEYKNDDAVKAYRSYYKSKEHSKGGVRYVRGDVPDWWEAIA